MWHHLFYGIPYTTSVICDVVICSSVRPSKSNTILCTSSTRDFARAPVISDHVTGANMPTDILPCSVVLPFFTVSDRSSTLNIDETIDDSLTGRASAYCSCVVLYH